MRVVALVRTPRLVGRLERAAHGFRALAVVPTWAQAVARGREIDANVLVAEVPCGGPGDVVQELRTFRNALPRAVPVLYVPLGIEAMQSLPTLCRAGVQEVVVLDHDDEPAALRAVLSRAAASGVLAAVLDTLRGVLPGALLPAAALCLEHLARAPGVPALAAAVGVAPRTLCIRCTRLGLRGPQELASRVRVLLACALLQDPRRTLDQVALHLGYDSGAGLANLVRRHLGCAVGEARARPLAEVAAALVGPGRPVAGRPTSGPGARGVKNLPAA